MGDESGAFFIDSSPDMFRYVLDWCRYKQLLVDSEHMDWNSLMVVADYFGLEEMRSEVRKRWDQKKEKDQEIMQVLTQFRNEVREIKGEVSEWSKRWSGGMSGSGGMSETIREIKREVSKISQRLG